MNYDKQSYKLILQKALDQGFNFVDFFSVDLNKIAIRQIILRHDIDFSPELANEMGKIDAEFKIKSTFAVQLSSPLYNPFTSTNIRLINEISQMNHNIVLHHRYVPGKSVEESKQAISTELQVIRSFFPYVLPLFVWHNPPPANLLSEINVPGMINAYSNKYLKNMFYISDSVLRHKPEALLKALENQRCIHMLLHPIIWMSGKKDAAAMINSIFPKIIRECEKECILNPAWKENFPDGIPQEIIDGFLKALDKT
jgi:hypothetical protein